MKPTSIIFLIVSLVVVLLGFATLGVASGLATSQGVELGMPASEDGNYYAEPDFDAEAVGKISVALGEATVNVIGGAEKSYVELINFTEGMYAASSSNRVFTLNDSTELTSFSSIISMVSGFKGLRTFVDYFEMRNLERTVNIYLCDDYPINAVEITLQKGEVNIKNNRTLTDYYVDIKSGEFNMIDVGTTSVVKVEVASGDVRLDDCDIEQMSVTVKAGNVQATAQVNRFTVNVESGDFDYSCYSSIDATNVKLAASAGTITVDGNAVGGFMQTSDAATGNVIDATVSVGDITVKTNAKR